MSKVYRFIYDSEFDTEEPTTYPEASTVKVRHYFADFTAWPTILHEFCKFLEATGYNGVMERVVLKDPYNMERDGLFETIGPNQYIATDEFMEKAEPLDNEDKDDCDVEEVRKELKQYFDSLSEAEKKDLKKQGYNV
jgi:hypothetical protein